MQKAKFNIKGMHCNSCAVLIEERLKDKPGITKVRVGYDSQKAAVVYDEQKIKESDILRVIKEAGDYRVEKIEEDEEIGSRKERIRSEEKFKENNLGRSPGKLTLFPIFNNTNFLIGFLAGFSVLSLIFNIFFGVALFKPGLIGLNSAKDLTAQIQELPSQPDSVEESPSEPTDNFPSGQVFDITENDNVRGDFNAPITLVEFSDFECPFCARHYPTLNKVLADYKGRVRLVYKHFPLDFHPNAQKAAEASECAAEQGKFWEYYDKLFDNLLDGYSVENFKKWARELGLNTSKFNTCLDSGKYSQKVEADYQEGIEKGVNGTPATFVNGRLVGGALPYEVFKQTIDGLSKQ